jgi:hypothetical protein
MFLPHFFSEDCWLTCRYHGVQKSFQSLLHKEQGHRAVWEYPFAVAGINLTFLLIQILDLRSGKILMKNGFYLIAFKGFGFTLKKKAMGR